MARRRQSWPPDALLGLGVAAAVGATAVAARAIGRLRSDGAELGAEDTTPSVAARTVGRLRGGGPRAAGPSRAYRLRNGEKAGRGLRRVALGRADRALEQLDAAEGGDFAASVHEARKDMKKLRAVLRLTRKRLGEDLYRRENRRYRDAARLLSASRDAEVKPATLDALAERFGAEFPDEGVRGWREVLELERTVTVRVARGDGIVAESRAEVAAGRELIPTLSLKGSSWRLVGPGLGRSYRRGRRAMRRLLDEPTGELVHEWRKRAKDLQYQLRILRDVWPTVLGDTADEAHRLTDLLGDHHDLTVLAEDAARRQGLLGRAEPRLQALIARRQEELLEDAVALGRRLYAEKPDAFGARFRAYWDAWSR